MPVLNLCTTQSVHRPMATQSSPAAATCNLTVYYDGSCPLCRSEIGLYRKAQGSNRIDFVDVSAIEGRAVAPDLTQADAMARFHVRKSDGALASGAAGFAQLWLTLPRWKWLGWFVGAAWSRDDRRSRLSRISADPPVAPTPPPRDPLVPPISSSRCRSDLDNSQRNEHRRDAPHQGVDVAFAAARPSQGGRCPLNLTCLSSEGSWQQHFRLRQSSARRR